MWVRFPSFACVTAQRVDHAGSSPGPIGTTFIGHHLLAEGPEPGSRLGHRSWAQSYTTSIHGRGKETSYKDFAWRRASSDLSQQREARTQAEFEICY